MSHEREKQVVRRFFAALDGRNLAGCADLIWPDATVHYNGMPEMKRDQYRQMGEGYLAAFSDVRHEIEEQLADGDRVITRLTYGGRHTGPFAGIPATGRSFSAGALRIDRFKDGRIADVWIQADLMAMLQQLGVVPAMQGRV